MRITRSRGIGRRRATCWSASSASCTSIFSSANQRQPRRRHQGDVERSSAQRRQQSEPVKRYPRWPVPSSAISPTSSGSRLSDWPHSSSTGPGARNPRSIEFSVCGPGSSGGCQPNSAMRRSSIGVCDTSLVTPAARVDVFIALRSIGDRVSDSTDRRPARLQSRARPDGASRSVQPQEPRDRAGVTKPGGWKRSKLKESV
jgi:hypothetical protein